MLKRSTYYIVVLCNVMFFMGALALGISLGIDAAIAACSPGIPCVPPDFDLYTYPLAGQDSSLNGPKTGKDENNYTETACDGNFMNQIYSKAYMEGNRQIIMSEQIIHKPDSVLEYTCFGNYLDETTAEAIESQFSYTKYWKEKDTNESSKTKAVGLEGTYVMKKREDLDPTQRYQVPEVYREDFNYDDKYCGATKKDSDLCANNLNEALQYIVRDALNDYLASNFSHTYLGGATTIDSNSSLSSCTDMATVWNIAKCLDFGEDDKFRTFESLVSADPRSIPEECSSGHSSNDSIDANNDSTKLDQTTPDNASSTISSQCPPTGTTVAGVNTDFSNSLINVANNCANSSGEHAYTEMDLVEYEDFITFGAGQNSGFYIPGTGGATTGTVNCALPLPTGIPVITIEYDPEETSGDSDLFKIPSRNKYVHYEYICPNPGCYYRPKKILISETANIPDSTPIGTCVPY